MKHAREVTFEPSTVCKDGTDERSRKWRGGHTPKRGEWLKRSETQWWRWSANGRPYSRSAAARRERVKGQVLGTPIQSCARPRCKAPWSTSIRLCPCPAAARPGQEESQGWEAKVMPWRRSLWIWSAAGRPCGEETRETQKRRRKDREGGNKDEGRAGGRGDCVIACVWVRLYGGAARHAGGPAGAPIWWSRRFFFFCFFSLWRTR